MESLAPQFEDWSDSSGDANSAHGGHILQLFFFKSYRQLIHEVPAVPDAIRAGPFIFLYITANQPVPKSQADIEVNRKTFNL